MAEKFARLDRWQPSRGGHPLADAEGFKNLILAAEKAYLVALTAEASGEP